MSWTPRQREMLAEMGLRVWPRPEAEPPAPAPSAAPERPVETVAAEKNAANEVANASQTAPAARPPAVPVAPVAAATPVASEPAPVFRRPDGVDAMDWPALREAVSGCTACALCQKRTQAVFGVGHERAHVMVVGEAPGEQEDLQGEPFVGKSGQLLDQMLAAVGLTRAEADAEHQVFIANVLKCRPPMNRNPTPEEVAQCEPFLLRQVQLVQPRLILAMGKFAIESLLRTQEPVGRLRGRVHRYAGVPVVVSYHPAYLLRQPLEKARAWDDLCLAREVLAQ